MLIRHYPAIPSINPNYLSTLMRNAIMANIINLTPHTINLYSTIDCEETVKGTYKSLVLKEGAQPLVTYPSQGVARAASSKELVYTINNIPVYTTVYGEPEGLPEPAPNTYFIVSVLTAQAAKGRHDLLIIDGAVRNAEGQIVGCTAFGRIYN